MRKVTLKIEDFLHQALRLKAADTKQSMSELVIDSLEVYFEEYLSNEIVSDTSNHSKPLEPESKREILSRLLEESQSIKSAKTLMPQIVRIFFMAKMVCHHEVRFT